MLSRNQLLYINSINDDSNTAHEFAKFIAAFTMIPMAMMKQNENLNVSMPRRCLKQTLLELI
jgi:hypothetical protein